MSFINIINAYITKNLIYLGRYKFNTIVGIIMMVLIFFSIAFGYEKMNKHYNYESIEMVLGAYLSWFIMTTNLSYVVNSLAEEFSLGVFEQIYINSKSIYLVFIAKAISSLILSLLQILIILSLIIFISNQLGIDIIINYLSSIPIIIIGIISIWGLGFIINGFVIYYKNINSLYTAVSSMLFAILTYAINKSSILAIIFPFGMANKVIQKTLISGVLPNFNNWIVIIVNSITFFLIGFLVLRFFIQKALNKGLLNKH